MPKARTVYVCRSCGYESPKWNGQCPSCKEWNTLEEVDALPAADKPSGDEMHSPDEPWVGGRFIHGSVLAYKLDSVRTILPKI